ncbi:hypothetical protein VNO77_07808 [Canavalia gladiata]|uniref:Uncharacterized protein n=1 Tax=Canavalia gladiata TaxID=3824 RepID=A0AAN9M7X5_CANGL
MSTIALGVAQESIVLLAYGSTSANLFTRDCCTIKKGTSSLSLPLCFPKSTVLVLSIVPRNSSSSHKNICLRKEDRSCITWLDNQKPKSVLYVSFGTVVKLSHEQLLEFWHGLVNSFKSFLWVIRKDLINGESDLSYSVPVELELATKERGLLVDWAPQEELKLTGAFFNCDYCQNLFPSWVLMAESQSSLSVIAQIAVKTILLSFPIPSKFLTLITLSPKSLKFP